MRRERHDRRARTAVLQLVPADGFRRADARENRHLQIHEHQTVAVRRRRNKLDGLGPVARSLHRDARSNAGEHLGHHPPVHGIVVAHQDHAALRRTRRREHRSGRDIRARGASRATPIPLRARPRQDSNKLGRPQWTRQPRVKPLGFRRQVEDVMQRRNDGDVNAPPRRRRAVGARRRRVIARRRRRRERGSEAAAALVSGHDARHDRLLGIETAAANGATGAPGTACHVGWEREQTARRGRLVEDRGRMPTRRRRQHLVGVVRVNG
mmetsp:Transcript_3662/g.13432  ORF Transcript_3662/g.13432 Transcript_3662/m.13432 type:complete len:267 (+) Transcript_3662:2797-3597(+)